MKYTVHETKQFRKDRRRCIRQGLPQEELDAVVLTLAAGEALPPEYEDHPLHGNLEGYRDCHIRPDWVLLYRIQDATLVLVLQRTGTHAEVLRR